jgi:hypothetical protein
MIPLPRCLQRQENEPKIHKCKGKGMPKMATVKEPAKQTKIMKQAMHEAKSWAKCTVG